MQGELIATGSNDTWKLVDLVIWNPLIENWDIK